MDTSSTNALTIAYYLSRFDKLAVKNLGYANYTEAFEKTSKIIHANPANIKNMRDGFDPIHENKRVGWYQRKMTKSRCRIVDEYSKYTEEELRKTVLDILSENNANKIVKEEIVVDDLEILIEYINSYIITRSFLYSPVTLSNFYLSLKTKPFVILAGISGSGKSKLVRLFAEAIGATKENGRFNMISVKPDWNDSTELLGYKNINEEFVPGKLIKIICEASKAENKDKPYFICLDEMNLARVEYYLSDYLSLIESREVSESGEILTDKLFSVDYLGENNPYSNLYIPENIYIVGTVNMDDTTFAFSRKVLDRANTIEFSDVNLQSLDFPDEDIQCNVLKNNFLKTSFLTIKDAIRYDKDYVNEINNKIIAINSILRIGNKHFGYRVRDEIVFYMLENKIAGLLSEDNAFDFQIMQKVLPIITGSEYIVKEILIKIFNYCSPSGEIADGTEYLDDAEKFKENALYIESADKIIKMLRGYEDGFASFWG
ncbi:AAA family ATPase [Clostridium bowmanii]|uniref:McrB family protein n=1 Tax=Clostridium bowmanii TaxID=132925 RepID=UPI001C0DD899|nr:AAA family ATPase [Clostridium bowmanii]MBU3188336.1 AAA family ATPase [Clostridium bowmanii]MCA1072724.1 AAA family ATPase [Clostridium bowmanii]